MRSLSAPESHFGVQVALKMGSSRHKGFSITFQAADHQCPLQRRDDEGRDFLCIHTAPDLSPLDSGADNRAKAIAPVMESLASAIAQHRIAIIRIDGCIQQWAATRNGWAPVNKVRKELLELIDAVWDSIKIVHSRIQGYFPGVVECLGRQFFFRGEVAIDAAFFKTGGLHQLRHGTTYETALIEQDRCLSHDPLSGFLTFWHCSALSDWMPLRTVRSLIYQTQGGSAPQPQKTFATVRSLKES